MTAAPNAAKATQILMGALREFLALGYAGTSVDRIAKAAGVSKPTVYAYFQNKENLFKALVQHMAQERFFAVLSQAPLVGEPETVLRELAIATINRLSESPEQLNFMRLVLGESGRFPELSQAFLQAITKPALEQVSHYLASRPELQITDPAAIAQILLGTILFYVVTQELMHGYDVMPMGRDRLIEQLIGMVTRSAHQGG
ncbi:MAG: TetR/AcrR family transcriptional regulator [Cyanobacteria bacterium P01_G01_bin.54]